LAGEGLDRLALLRLGRRAARAEAALAARAETLRACLDAAREPGRFAADISALASEPEEILLRILADELKLIAPGKELRLDRLEALARGVGQSLHEGRPFTATLGGSVLRLTKGQILVIAREGARRQHRTSPP
jgi:tRNA(Ile)-lysidine synthase